MERDAWYFDGPEGREGPFARTEMEHLAEIGRLEPDTPVWREGFDAWEPARRHFVELAPYRTSKPQKTPQAAPGFEGRHEGSPNGAEDFRTAVAEGFRRYVDFRGRSNRPEFWYWALFALLGGVITGLADQAFLDPSGRTSLLNSLFSLGTFLPSLAVSARRLHDIGRSGWWLLLLLLPIIGWIVLIVWYCQPGDRDRNDWG